MSNLDFGIVLLFNIWKPKYNIAFDGIMFLSIVGQFKEF